VSAEFEPTLGKQLFGSIQQMNEISNDPNNHGQHLGSAWQHGWYGYAIHDLRAILEQQRARTAHRRARRARAAARKRKRRAAPKVNPADPGALSRVYCGGGRLAACREGLAASLKQALGADPKKMYEDPICKANGMDGDQWCYDSVYFRPLGAVTQPLIHWINRPTFQQAVEIQGHRP
jgi:hypothetical protein